MTPSETIKTYLAAQPAPIQEHLFTQLAWFLDIEMEDPLADPAPAVIATLDMGFEKAVLFVGLMDFLHSAPRAGAEEIRAISEEIGNPTLQATVLRSGLYDQWWKNAEAGWRALRGSDLSFSELHKFRYSQNAAHPSI